MHPFHHYELATARQKGQLRESWQRKLARQARRDQPSLIGSLIKQLGGLGASLLGRLGGLLIKTGGKLQEQVVPPVPVEFDWAEK